MRVFIIAAVLGILVQPAVAFNDDYCASLKDSAYSYYHSERGFRTIAMSRIPNGFENASKEDQEGYELWWGYADEALERASHYANVYQAFCEG